MWGSSWTAWTGIAAIIAVLLAAVFTAWTPIFAILIVLALIPVGAFFVVARRRGEEEEGPDPRSQWADASDDAPTHDVKVEDGMVSDRRRAHTN
jgi:hypothetical protein